MNGQERGENDSQVLRRVLAGLRDGEVTPQVAGVLTLPLGRRGRRDLEGEWAGPAPRGDGVRGGLPAPPPWATHSVVEDGGVTHERVCAAHPLAWLDRSSAGSEATCPTDVSVSVVDRPGAVRWVRLPPTIQIEGGSYTLLEARRLIRAVEALIALAQ